jgi:hypothetical protein
MSQIDMKTAWHCVECDRWVPFRGKNPYDGHGYPCASASRARSAVYEIEAELKAVTDEIQQLEMQAAMLDSLKKRQATLLVKLKPHARQLQAVSCHVQADEAFLRASHSSRLL